LRPETSVDADLNGDSKCKDSISPPDATVCNVVGQRSEYLAYKFKSTGEEPNVVDFSFRIASTQADENFKAIVYNSGGSEIASKLFTGPGNGRLYETLHWSGIDLGDGTDFELKVEFLAGRVRFCSWAIKYSEGPAEPVTAGPSLGPDNGTNADPAEPITAGPSLSPDDGTIDG
jgi:hypothetical protein